MCFTRVPQEEKKKKKKKKKRGKLRLPGNRYMRVTGFVVSDLWSKTAAAQWAETWRSWQGAAGTSQAPSGNMGMPAWPPAGHMGWGQWAPGMPGWPPGHEDRPGTSMGSEAGHAGWAVAERDDVGSSVS
ncbi:unnamed protein product [Cladocopium goreaui]|uniref:Uncharacterized protein n=1 Tax=Cladocopium goreaui TaxID=2562237 RepID=A0A9P1D8L7_9DINO|nr:unnamed protein product [Cladocopium goreaui]